MQKTHQYNQHLSLNFCSENHLAVGQRKTLIVLEGKESFPINI